MIFTSFNHRTDFTYAVKLSSNVKNKDLTPFSMTNTTFPISPIYQFPETYGGKARAY